VVPLQIPEWFEEELEEEVQVTGYYSVFALKTGAVGPTTNPKWERISTP